jgi:DNA primase
MGFHTTLDLRCVRHLTAYGLHDDSTPSLQLYDHDWHCFGCRIGGSVYDFGARLYGLDTRGREFLQLRQRLAEKLLPLTLVSNRHGSCHP